MLSVVFLGCLVKRQASHLHGPWSAHGLKNSFRKYKACCYWDVSHYNIISIRNRMTTTPWSNFEDIPHLFTQSIHLLGSFIHSFIRNLISGQVNKKQWEEPREKDQECGHRQTAHTLQKCGPSPGQRYLHLPELGPGELQWESCGETGRGPTLHKLRACEIPPAAEKEQLCSTNESTLR